MKLPFFKIFDEGYFYSKIIDPILQHQHKKVAKIIPPNSIVIDIACGTGALTQQIAPIAKSITAIDQSESMINQAKSLQIANIEYHVMDATDLSRFQDNEFDYATISMAIHQFPRDLAKQILLEMKRIAKNIIILDYMNKMPKRFPGYLVIFAEWLAGNEHNGNFRQFIKHGGIDTILKECDLAVKNKIVSGNKIFNVVECEIGYEQDIY